MNAKRGLLASYYPTPYWNRKCVVKCTPASGAHKHLFWAFPPGSYRHPFNNTRDSYFPEDTCKNLTQPLGKGGGVTL